MTELKPCPFCGDKMTVVYEDVIAHAGHEKPCPIRSMGFMSLPMWNTRSPDTTALEARVMVLTEAMMKAAQIIKVGQPDKISDAGAILREALQENQDDGK